MLTTVRSGRTMLVMAVTLAAMASSISLPAGSEPAAGITTDRPTALSLVAGAPAVTIERQPGQPRVDLNLGTYLVAGRSAFEVWVTRESYDDPIVARQVSRTRGGVRTRDLDSEIVQDTGGFYDFLHVTVTDSAGATVLDLTQDFCPNGHTLRLRPDAPDTSPYPASCPGNPFTLGAVWGIQAGWGTETRDPSRRVNTGHMPDGQYTARISVTRPYRDAFAIPAQTATVEVTLQTAPAQSQRLPQTEPPHPAEPIGPAGPARVPDRSRPDLIPLPAWAIDILGDNPGTPEVEPERLIFAADVWNAGPSPLVIEGFRRPDQALMDTYQYFYDDSEPVGYAPVGSMEWDTREGHHHWHFRDFAGYRLLDGDGREAVRSQKEAFCLANTDAINLFVPNAPWQPEHTDLHSACGNEGSPTVRQALATGHGDTYPNSAPGRALEITDLPNGTYYIEVTANPDRNLYETRLDNNAALRQVILGGVPGSRTVQVPPYGLIDTDPGH